MRDKLIMEFFIITFTSVIELESFYGFFELIFDIVKKKKEIYKKKTFDFSLRGKPKGSASSGQEK